MARFDELVDSAGLYVPAIWRGSLSAPMVPTDELESESLTEFDDRRLDFVPHDDDRTHAEIQDDLQITRNPRAAIEHLSMSLLRLSVDGERVPRGSRVYVYHALRDTARAAVGNVMRSVEGGDRGFTPAEHIVVHELYPLVSFFQKLVLGRNANDGTTPPDRFGIYVERGNEPSEPV